MRNQQAQKLSIIGLCMLLMATLMIVPVSANESEKKALQSQSLGKVSLKENVVAEVNNVVMIPSDHGKLVGFTLSVHNNSNAELNFIDYWVELRSKSGANFTVNAVNKDINNIAAKSTKDIIFYSQVGADVSLTDLAVRVIRWDFSFDSYTRVLGTIEVPKQYNQVTPGAAKRLVSAENTQLAFGIERATIGESEKYFRPDIEISIKNEGKRSLMLPNYEIAVLTNDGLLYPLTSRNMTNISLSPQSEEDFKLTASIPNSVNSQDWKLAVLLPVEDGKSQVPLAIFELPDEMVEQADDFGKYYTFSTKDGIYNIKIDSMNRLPIEDQDLIVANLTILNPGTDSIPLPSFTGKYMFNDSIERLATVSANDKIISISPNQSVQVQAVSKVPYTLEITDVDLTVQQQDSGEDQELINLVEFSSKGIFDAVPVIQSNQSYTIDELGYRATVSIHKTLTFEGSNANIIGAQVKIENKESRLTNMQKMAGYFESIKGSIYQAEFQSIEEKLSPNGSAIFYAWATVPKTEDIDSMRLVIGKAVEELKSDGKDSQLIGYVNPNEYELPESMKAQENLQNIDLHPYLLTINKVGSQILYGEKKVVLDLDYTLEKDMLAKTNMEGQKLIVEIHDSSEDVKLEKILTLPESKQEGSLSELLELGDKKTIKLDMPDDKQIFSIRTLKEYELNFYLEFESGYKVLIATEKFPWFANRTLN